MPAPIVITYNLSPEEEQAVVATLLLQQPTAPDPSDEDVAAFVGSEFHRILAGIALNVSHRASELAQDDPKAAADLHAARMATVRRYVDNTRKFVAEAQARAVDFATKAVDDTERG
jgi:hypothetical protein